MLDTRRLSPSDLYEEEREGFGSLLVPPHKPARPSGLRIGSAAHNGERDRKRHHGRQTKHTITVGPNLLRPLKARPATNEMLTSPPPRYDRSPERTTLKLEADRL